VTPPPSLRCGELAHWTLDNLDSYWRPILSGSSGVLNRQSVIALTSYGSAWIALGISRLHYTLATGEICSKDAAGRYALQTFPEPWHRVLNEGLRIRRADRARADLASALAEITADLHLRSDGDGGSLYRTPFARRRDVLAFGNMVVADAFRRYARKPTSS